MHGDATTHEPIIYASKDDAIPVIDMFNSFLTIPDNNVPADPNAGGNVYKFSRAEKRVHDAILRKYSRQSIEWKSIRRMAEDLEIPSETVRVALKGRKSSQKAGATEGLLTKMPGLDTVMVSKSEDNTLMTPEEIKEWERNHMQNIIETGLGDGRTIRKYDTIT